MTDLFASPPQAPPGALNIYVDFYDDTEKASLQGSALESIFMNLPRQIPVPTQDLCTFYLYYKMRPGISGFANHTQIAQKWHQALDEFDGQVGFGQQSIYVLSLDGHSTGTTERLGEAIGLSVASELHGLHQADWARIPKAQTKTFDFRRHVASDSLHIIEVENKGSVVADVSLKSPSVSAHKKSIKDKKHELQEDGDGQTVRYGTIAILSDQANSIARCWLVDPPATMRENPRQFKILARLEYITELITLLGQRSTLAASLQTRMAALVKLRDITQLDRVQLLRGNGKEYSESTYTSGGRNPWFASKSVVSDDSVGGQIDLVSEHHFFYMGIREELVVYASRQDFAQIENYRFESESLRKSIDCLVPVGRFESRYAPELDIPEGERRRDAGYISFTISAILHYTRSGLVFGVAEIPEAWKRK
jgi:hypothetical protein